MQNTAARLRHVKAVRRGDSTWLYYRRGGRQWPLPGPEGSTTFLAEYHRIHAAYGRLRAETPAGVPGTVDAAIILYLSSADFRSLRATTQRDYRRVLDQFRGAFGPLHLADLGLGWWDRMRDKHVGAPIAWNNLRSRMREVIALYRRRHPELVPANPLAEVRRLRVEQSDQNRAWPTDLVAQVLAAATPAFRALLVGYLLTTQRGGDVTSWRWDQYDEEARLLITRQRKTSTPLEIPVTPPLAAAIESQRGRHPLRIFATPRGKAWTLSNAQETLARLLGQLGAERYTLHGLRATGPTALERAGLQSRHTRDLTGHGSERSYEVYVRGAGSLTGRRLAAEALESIFAEVVEGAEGGNPRRFTGITGRAARRGKLATDVETGNFPVASIGRKPR